MIKKTTFLALALSAILSMFGCGEQKPVLYFYTWDDYISKENVKEFEEKYNCKVRIDTFPDNESMIAKIKGGATGYDLVLPTSYAVEILKDNGLLEELDHSKLGNLKNIDEEFLGKFFIDKEMKYSVPFLVGYTCIAYNVDIVGELSDEEKSWAIFGNAKYKGKMTMLDDAPEVIGAALKYLGYPFNSRDPKQVEEAKNLLMQWKNNLAKFDSLAYKTSLVSKEFVITQGYSGDVMQVMDDIEKESLNINLDLFIPKEGTSISSDDFVILKSAKNKDLAYKFIDFMCTKEASKKNMEATYYFSPITGAMNGLDEEVREMVEISYETSEIIEELGEDRKMYNDAWEHIKM